MTMPYEPGDILTGTEAHLTKLNEAWRHIRERRAAGEALHNVSGLDRGLPMPDVDPALMDDEWAGALYGERVRELGLEHLGGTPGTHDIFVANRQTAALFACMQVVVAPGSTVVGVSATHSHPAVRRGVRDAGGRLIDTVGADGLEKALQDHRDVGVVAMTRLAVTYDAMPEDELRRAVELAHAHGAVVVMDDAGGARVGPALLGQPRTLELGVDLGTTGLDKYGTGGPRVGLLGGRADLVARVRARASELGSECRPVLYPAIARSLESYRPERVRELTASTRDVGDALVRRLGTQVVHQGEIISTLTGPAIRDELARRASAPVNLAPIEASAVLAMVLLRDHGLLTVHFAGLPPGTGDMLVKFLPPETVAELGGPDAFAATFDRALNTAALVAPDLTAVRTLLLGSA